MINLLINADDFGISDEVNQAIDFCFINNFINRATVMVNMPATEKAVELAKAGGYLNKVGIHINLISGIPLSEGIKNTIFCTNGEFNGKVLKKQINRIYLNKKTRVAVKKEIEAQLSKYLDYGFTLMHLDSHEHSHASPSVFLSIRSLFKKYGVNSIRLSRNIPLSKITGLKKVYKDICNKRLLRFNKKNIRKDRKLISFFGSQDDVELFLTECMKDTCNAEMMIHPIMSGGQLKDVFNKVMIADWLEQNKTKIALIQV